MSKSHEKLVLALEVLQNATNSELTKFLNDSSDKKYIQHSITARICELVQMNVYKIASERKCSITGFVVLSYELTGKPIPNDYVYQPIKKRLGRNQLFTAFNIANGDNNKLIELLGFKQ